MKVSVFGSSQPKPNEAAYQEGLLLGRLLALSGHTVLTGGYIGTMEAVSRGAAEVGGHVIGVTCDEIERWRPVAPNSWIHEERRYPTLRQRLFALIDDCDAAISLPGGIGTLAEVAVMWSHLQAGVISPRPLILIGDGWQKTINTFISVFSPHIPDPYRQLITLVQDVKTAVSHLNRHFA